MATQKKHAIDIKVACDPPAYFIHGKECLLKCTYSKMKSKSGFNSDVKKMNAGTKHVSAIYIFTNWIIM